MGTQTQQFSFLNSTPPSGLPRFAWERYSRDVQEIRDLLLSLQESTDREQEVGTREALNRAAWDLLETIVWARTADCPDPRPQVVVDSFSEEERLYLDTGWVGTAVTPATAEELKAALSTTTFGPVKLQVLHEYAGAIAGRIFRARDVRSVKDRIATAEKELTAKKVEAAAAYERVHTLIDSMEDSDQARRLQVALDEIAVKLAACRNLLRHTKQEDLIREQKQLTESWNRLRNKQARVVETYLERKSLSEAQNSYLAVLTEVKKAEHSLHRLRAQVAEGLRAGGELEPEELFPVVSREFEELREILRKASKLQKEAVPTVYLAGKPSWIPERIFSVCSQVLKTDKRLAQAWTSRKWPVPQFFLIPGRGSGVLYRREQNQIWIPLVTHELGFCSLLRAIGMYRFYQGEKERESFAALDAYEDLRSEAERAEAFAGAYDTYITREVKGFRKLPASVARWFRLNLM